MKNLIFIFLILIGAVARAKDVISADELRPQVILQVQTFTTDQSGRQIEYISSSQSRYSLQVKRGDISSVYMDNPKDFSAVRLDFTFKINADKSMSLAITQYASVEFDTSTGKVTKEGKGRSETFTLSDFGSVSWVSESTSAGRVVTRFTPLISDESAAMKLTYTPMSLVNVIITDNAGRVWTEGSSADGEVITFQTHQGTLYVSFTEFKGAKEIGKAKGGVVELNLTEKLNVRIRSEKSVLGEGISAKVFGAYVPSDKSPSRTASSVGAMPASEAIKRISSGK
ncbi:MAG: hypothetical protein IPJ71_14340 [Bdellovibrionales bacterium]|nr:hypothetical protein [Bdellovibrionales bacterium]